MVSEKYFRINKDNDIYILLYNLIKNMSEFLSINFLLF